MISDENSLEIKLLNDLYEILPNNETRVKNCGIFFNGIRGQNMQTSDSPSWYNKEEARTLFYFIINLYKFKVSPDDIGIITPYSQQVKLIRKLLDDAGMKQPKCGSVEEFQGQERKIILVSTVRSSSNLINSDKRHYLGFVGNSKRLNVAISRARYIKLFYY